MITHHATIINGIISLLFNVYDIIGNYKNGPNCHISYITYNNNKFKLIMVPSTDHFTIYNKKYNNIN